MASRGIQGTLMPFLYPCAGRWGRGFLGCQRMGTLVDQSVGDTHPTPDGLSDHDVLKTLLPSTHFNPSPDDYALTPFTDRCTLTLHSGSGGHGCISFLREKYISDGPANGGDGGSGGNVFIQAVRGETSLHKLARRGILKAGRGKSGQGKGKGGERGEDLLVQVPVGTVVREVERWDPVADEEERVKIAAGASEGEGGGGGGGGLWRRDKWTLYPGGVPGGIASMEFPSLPRIRRSQLALSQPQAPIRLDLSDAMESPILLAAGAMGGLGNPHFVSKSTPRPKFATKGDHGMRITLELELKLLADVGLVGLPNAGKSTLLRSLTRSRARVGNWEFTTLQPNIGTVVLDNNQGRPKIPRGDKSERTRFTIADIPGLVAGAHLDRGLGLGFLRHVERAGVLAFVVDLGAGDAVEAVEGLWKEVRMYEQMRSVEEKQEREEYAVTWKPISEKAAERHMVVDDGRPRKQQQQQHHNEVSTISQKPWFIVGTKADLPGAKENFERLREWLAEKGGLVGVFPVCALKGEGVDRVVDWVARSLERCS
ncbi:MAG: GTPase of the mitochondrial inner membrane that associates with the large ribosomal subunit [Geoglossum simile]|nr:MAG: GTPase of the mitochondrial inner membrane that associates with the large ribosomal subunit [Geoglossum simile]